MKQYAVFTVGRKLKDISQVVSFKKHALREYNTPNADKDLTEDNKIIIGDENIKENFKEYISGIKLRRNAVLARDMILSTSHDYMVNMPPAEKERWIYVNREFLREYFGPNCIFAIAHKDEFQPLHIHALIVPKFENNKGEPTLSNARYFDGISKMMEWQDTYYDYISKEFEGLNRGIKYSKADHVSIKKVYGVITGESSIKNLTLDEAIKAYELLKIKYDILEERLEKYTNQLQMKNAKIEELQKNIVNPVVNQTVQQLQNSFILNR